MQKNHKCQKKEESNKFLPYLEKPSASHILLTINELVDEQKSVSVKKELMKVLLIQIVAVFY